jgi:hypothetical protein
MTTMVSLIKKVVISLSYFVFETGMWVVQRKRLLTWMQWRRRRRTTRRTTTTIRMIIFQRMSFVVVVVAVVVIAGYPCCYCFLFHSMSVPRVCAC